MKKSSFLFLTFVSVLSSIASTGSAVLPHWQKSATESQYIYVSNVSPSVSRVSITLFQKNGIAYTESSELGTQISFDGFTGSPLNLTGAVLSGNHSGYVKIDALEGGETFFGYALIEWTSTDNKSVSLVAYGKTESGGEGSSKANDCEVNGGKAF